MYYSICRQPAHEECVKQCRLLLLLHVYCRAIPNPSSLPFFPKYSPSHTLLHTGRTMWPRNYKEKSLRRRISLLSERRPVPDGSSLSLTPWTAHPRCPVTNLLCTYTWKIWCLELRTVPGPWWRSLHFVLPIVQCIIIAIVHLLTMTPASSTESGQQIFIECPDYRLKIDVKHGKASPALEEFEARVDWIFSKKLNSTLVSWASPETR